VGDILLANGTPSRMQRTAGDIFANAGAVFDGCDVVLGNLECTLPGDGRTVLTQPRVIASAELVAGIKAAGFGAVTLANNHMFDCLEGGFSRLRHLLEKLGIVYFGAGDNLDQAAAPAFLERNGLRLALIAAADRRSGCRQFATETSAGVAPLDIDRLRDGVLRARGEADVVLVSLHWGEERLAIPSPEQIAQAHGLVEAGASLVLGHHPHVIQGLEMHRGAAIVYSLGNFVACEVPYSDGYILGWNRCERTGCVLYADLTREGCRNIRQEATFDDGQTVAFDCNGYGRRRIDKVNRDLARGVSLRRYRREYLWVKTIRPALGYLRWSRLKTLRPRQFRNALVSLLLSRKAQ
jgi:poly-gamma-glutamate synthesis protein (capsule biosynthesis protein)